MFLNDHTRIHFNRAAARSCQDISPKRKYLNSRNHNGFLSYKCESTSSENKLKKCENPATLNMERGERCQSDPYICKEMICMLPARR
ncbi:uncharacterized protein LOC108740622 isoform X2 [Agrilus planipennis]|uniref:Uncharacterized protein LOC108740622 isoform X2 n=1 Tax=Agrilus planipennis TaxID=224129 RepID=A0A7F5QZX3_AGRPL|nr:uncharacterized protein LOC108740622 isoform X2 [Agrilus planipennis]